MTPAQNEELHQTANLGMYATLDSLVREQIITREVADKFIRTHTAVILTRRTTWGRVRDFLFADDKKEDGKQTITCHVVPLYLEDAHE